MAKMLSLAILQRPEAAASMQGLVIILGCVAESAQQRTSNFESEGRDGVESTSLISNVSVIKMLRQNNLKNPSSWQPQH